MNCPLKWQIAAGQTEQRKFYIYNNYLPHAAHMKKKITAAEIELAELTRCFTIADRYVVVLSSQLCFYLPEIDAGQSRRDVASQAYRLESHLPVDAEAMSFVCMHSGSAKSAAVVDGHSLSEAIASVEALANKMCLAVTPLATLVIDHLGLATENVQRIVILGEQSCDLLQVTHGQLSRWEWVEFDINRIADFFAESPADTTLDDLRIVLLPGCAAEWASMAASLEMVPCLDWRADDWLPVAASTILTGERIPTVNFTDGALASVDPYAPLRGTQSMFLASVASLLLFAAVGFFWRGQRYVARAEAMTTEQTKVFTELYPNQPIPVGMLSRIESEFRRLSATRDEAKLPPVADSLPPMRAFWTSFPSEGRFSVSTLHFVPQRLERIDGLAKSYADLELLRTSLSQAGFEVPPVSSSTAGAGVTLRWEQVPWNPSPPAALQEAF